MRNTEEEGIVVFGILLAWPENNVLKLVSPIPSQSTKVTMLGYPNSLTWTAGPGGQGIYITIPNIPYNHMPCEWAWVFKMTMIQN